MVGFSIDPTIFRCTAEVFAAELVEAGMPGVGQGRYYLMPAGLTFLQKAALQEVYPFSQPPARRKYRYSGDDCPTAMAFLGNFIRWATFCEKYREKHCEMAIKIVRQVAEKNRA